MAEGVHKQNTLIFENLILILQIYVIIYSLVRISFVSHFNSVWSIILTCVVRKQC